MKKFEFYVRNLLLTKVVNDKTSRGVTKEAYKMFSVLIGCCESQEKMLQVLHQTLPSFVTIIV